MKNPPREWYFRIRKRVRDRHQALLSALFVLLILPAAVSADNFVGGIPLTTVQSGTVSGDVYIDAGNTWWPASPGPQSVTRTFSSIPDISDIQWARLYVAVYCGHMQSNYQGTVTTEFDGDGDGTFETPLGPEPLNVPFTFIISGGNDNSAFPGHGTGEPYKLVNDHTNRVSSDYITWYDVTSEITSPAPRARVTTSAVSGSFDGRIKLITLVVAYNDGDTDEVSYWVNAGHDTDTYYSDENLGEDFYGFTEFDLSGLTGNPESATLTANHMASSDGLYLWQGEDIPSDPEDGNFQGAYYGYNIWDLTDDVRSGDIFELEYSRSGGEGTGEYSGQFYKIPLAVLTFRKSPLVVPQAEFSADPVSGETPLTVQFSDCSAGPPSSWKWEYRYKPAGSSTWGSWTQFASTKNPSYEFTGTGSYLIRLTAANTLGSNTKTNGSTSSPSITVTEAAPPVAAFSALPTSGSTPLAVAFTDESTGSITSWAWDFDHDGTTDSTEQNPTYRYESPGQYSVSLNVAGPGGTGEEIKTGYISVSEPLPVAAFTSNPRSGNPPLLVRFTDQSTGSPVSWDWAFRNATSDWTRFSTDQNPEFAFPEGTYDINLTVINTGGSDDLIKAGEITVAPGSIRLDANFTTDKVRGNAPLVVSFSDISGGSVSGWTWDFDDDGKTDSNLQNPVHTYTESGKYTVNLTISGPDGTDSERKVDYIKVRGDPTCDLTIEGAVSPVNLGGAVFAKEQNAIRILNVRNNGPSGSPVTTIQLTASDGFTTTRELEALASGKSVSVIIMDTTVRGSDGGLITYNATVDPDDDVAETDEDNNVRVSKERTVIYNGYKGKRYWNGGDILTSESFDIHGGLVHSFGDSTYHSGSFGGSGWTTYTVSWSSADLPIPSNAIIKKAILYVPYTWDNSNVMPGGASIAFNGKPSAQRSSYTDESNFGAYDDYMYGLITYDVTNSFKKNAHNTAAFTRSSDNAKVSMYGFTLAVVYEDPDSPHRQIILNEGFDLLGADEVNYGTTAEEATAYVLFGGPPIDTAQASSAELISFVASADGEGALLFNGRGMGGNNWNFGSVSGPQVAVRTIDVLAALLPSGNTAAIQSTPGETPAMAPIQQFLVVEVGGVRKNDNSGVQANFTATPLSGPAPLDINFTDMSVSDITAITSWAWDFQNDGIVDSTEQNPHFIYRDADDYTVNLTVSNGTAGDTRIRKRYIHIKNSTVVFPEERTETDPTPAAFAAPSGDIVFGQPKDSVSSHGMNDSDAGAENSFLALIVQQVTRISNGFGIMVSMIHDNISPIVSGLTFSGSFGGAG